MYDYYDYDDDRPTRAELAAEEEADRHVTGWCAECREECTSTTTDEGIGDYEFWGQKGTDTQLVEVSPCCDAEVLEYEPEDDHDEDYDEPEVTPINIREVQSNKEEVA